MKIIKISLVMLSMSAAVSAFGASPIEVNLKGPKGEDMGQATLTQMPNGVKINLKAKNISPGEHAIHFHEKASCVGPKFDSAGGHFAPAKNKHGKVSGGPHAGDMENITAGADGLVTAEIMNTQVRLGQGNNSLLRAGGTALVIHAKADDHKTQPSGDAGDRIACGEIQKLVTQ